MPNPPTEKVLSLFLYEQREIGLALNTDFSSPSIIEVHKSHKSEFGVFFQKY